jgi:mannose-6-phosphate isomerase-like protein (cupin superfamily)
VARHVVDLVFGSNSQSVAYSVKQHRTTIVLQDIIWQRLHVACREAVGLSRRVRDVDANYKGVQMSLAYLAQPEQQPTVEWLAGGTFAVLLDAAATNGQLGVGRFRVSMGEAPPYHKHLREDEVFMLIKGTALLWCDDEEMELSEGGIVFLPRNVPHSYRITSPEADLLMMCTPGGFEGMFRQAGKPVTSPRQPGAEPSREDMVKAADDFGQVVIGPPR